MELLFVVEGVSLEDAKLPEELPGGVKELDPVVPRVSHGNVGSVWTHGHAPGVIELRLPVPVPPEGEDEVSIDGVDADSMVVLVRNDEAEVEGINCDSGWPSELMGFLSVLTEAEDGDGDS